MKSVTLEIGLELISNELDNWDGGYSLPLTQAIKQANLPLNIALSIYDNRYEKITSMDQGDAKIQKREVYNLVTKQGWEESDFHGLKASTPFVPYWVDYNPIIEEVDPPQVTFMEEYREILGYKCQQAFWENDEGESWELWFTRELDWPEEFGGLWGLAEIPGMILEQTEKPGPDQVSAKHWTVLNISFQLPSETHFTPASSFASFPNVTEAQQAGLDLLKKELKQKPSCNDPLDSPWKLDGYPDELWLWLEKEKGETTLHLSGPGQTHQQFSAFVGNGFILATKGAESRVYKLNPEGDQLSQVGQTAFRFVRGSKRALKKFRGK